MNTRLFIALVVATAVTVAAALFLLRPDEPLQDPSGGVAIVQKQSVDRTTVLPEARSAGERETIETPPDPPTVSEAELLVPDQLPAIVMGRVINDTGQPLSGATIEVFLRPDDGLEFRLQSTGMITKTDAAGRFDAIVPIGRTVVIEARSIHAAPAHAQLAGVASGEALELGDMILKNGTTLHGIVSSSEGRPLAGVRVSIFDMSVAGGGPLGGRAESETLTDADGAYRIEHISEHQYSVNAELEGYSPMSSSMAFILGSGGVEWEQDFTLWPAIQVLAGVLISADGAGIPDAKLRLIKRQGNNLNTYFTVRGSTNEHGEFRFNQVPEGLFDVLIESPDWYTNLTVRLEAPRTDHEIIMHPALTVMGQLSVSGDMPSRFTVSVRPDGRTGARLLKGSAGTRTFEQTQPPGSFVFGGLRPGAYSFQVMAPGYALARSQDVILGSAQFSAQLVIPLTMGATLSGRVVRPENEGADLSTGTIELHAGKWDPGLAVETVFPTAPIKGQKKRLDADGGFVLKHVQAGSYVVTARVASAPPVHMRDVTLVEGQALDLGDITVIPGGRVSGIVRGMDGEPVAGATLRFTGKSFHTQVTTLNNGRFLATSMPPDLYEIEVSPAGLFQALKQHATGQVVVAANQESEVEFMLTVRHLDDL